MTWQLVSKRCYCYEKFEMYGFAIRIRSLRKRENNFEPEIKLPAHFVSQIKTLVFETTKVFQLRRTIYSPLAE